MIDELSKQYNPKISEDKWYKFWEENKLFSSKPSQDKLPYCIVIPPPNVTGILHMGHALNNSIQDILIRYKRMQGFESLWMPGTDHAGIATQNVVEKALAKEGLKRQDLGRQKFIQRVWQWKEQYGSTIIHQLKKLGASCDWSRERFTMDEDYSASVAEVFVALYEKKLIYQGNYIINWCPRCQTALSDEEAAHAELQGSLYYLKYPLKNNPLEFITVATTRPETMLGDTAVAVNPKDKRYKQYIGKTLILPLINRQIKIIADASVDMEFGTGAVKVTPAHDPNDYVLGKKHKLDFINVMAPDATMNDAAQKYSGLDRFKAREAILEDLGDLGLLEKINPHTLSAGHCYRCHTIVEPYLSKQWFVKMKPLARPAIEAVKKGKIKFHPQRWTKVYLNWMENIQDWCISRQIWWGHRIPVYYCKNCRQKNPEQGIIVSATKPDKCPKCKSADLFQEEDVLDTWFSSWLWPFATFYWPKESADLKYFYPTSTLVTAPEIIFFWVARMIMAGFEFKKQAPFKDIYIHGTVRDVEGKKMSKSLGNVIDPLEIIDEYGADALRFSLISITSQGQDVYLAKERFEQGRNFANKIWNASRFVLANLKPEEVNEDLCVFFKKEQLDIVNRWILSRFYSTLDKVGKELDGYKFNEAANSIYAFFWHEFCDWYLELIKPQINQKQTQVVMYKVLEKTLRMIHPFMPFITEEIWQRLPQAKNSIMQQSWPHLQKNLINIKNEQLMQTAFEIINTIRNMRAELDVGLQNRVNIKLAFSDKLKQESTQVLFNHIKNLAKIDSLSITEKYTAGVNEYVVLLKDMHIAMPLAGLVDAGAQIKKNQLKIDKLKSEIKNKEAMLDNKNFTQRAPKEIVEAERTKLDDMAGQIAKLEVIINGLR
ncbi:MAG: valine--tRNA ligase [Candidatus Omnitrophica bacterium CG11_big_fil_rev_8_21_14_0_20_41_12]|nr:MAG: valine--tRNA ligase [Candidatus Omnitrophica bacterium CG11_big_fil_rev_8_21_14_0_20_41_12]